MIGVITDLEDDGPDAAQARLLTWTEFQKINLYTQVMASLCARYHRQMERQWLTKIATATALLGASLLMGFTSPEHWLACWAFFLAGGLTMGLPLLIYIWRDLRSDWHDPEAPPPKVYARVYAVLSVLVRDAAGQVFLLRWRRKVPPPNQ